MLKISVVTVAYNNATQLRLTLKSLRSLEHPPFEIIVVDGSASQELADICWSSGLDRLVYVGEPDGGIYDAMNKGKRLAKGEAIHYLNSGDFVTGEPYRNWKMSELLPVKLVNASGKYMGRAGLRLGGTLYCHQGLLFPADHADYDLRYRICADYDAMLQTFPDGFRQFGRNSSGEVVFGLDGVSSNARQARDSEMEQILRIRRGTRHARVFRLFVTFRRFLPGQLLRTVTYAWRA